MDTGGFIIAILLGLLLIPSTIWLLVKVVRAMRSKRIMKEFEKRPLFHLFWALSALFCLLSVSRTISVFFGPPPQDPARHTVRINQHEPQTDVVVNADLLSHLNVCLLPSRQPTPSTPTPGDYEQSK